MKPHHLAVALIAVSTMGISACSSTNQAIKGETTPTSSQTQGGEPNWSYAGNTGPEYWGDAENASACKMGQEQSPINITQVTSSAANVPAINYSQSANVQINNNGHTVVYTPTTEDSTIELNNERYVLKQFHYHMPSEHQFSGQNYPGEIHFVHANSAGDLAVIGVMVKPGKANEVIRVLLNGTQLSTENKAGSTANKVNLSALAPAMPTYYHYTGSLTTPPCSEKVEWYVSKQPLELASDQIAIMTDLYDGNNRPVQSQGNRTIEQLSH